MANPYPTGFGVVTHDQHGNPLPQAEIDAAIAEDEERWRRKKEEEEYYAPHMITLGDVAEVLAERTGMPTKESIKESVSSAGSNILFVVLGVLFVVLVVWQSNLLKE